VKGRDLFFSGARIHDYFRGRGQAITNEKNSGLRKWRKSRGKKKESKGLTEFNFGSNGGGT